MNDFGLLVNHYYNIVIMLFADLTCACVFLCRGRVVYQLTLSLWRLLCQCYCAEVRLEVLKLTKHIEEGTIKARWRMRGLPLYSLLLRFYQKDKSHLYRYCKEGKGLGLIKYAVHEMFIFLVLNILK